MMLELLLAEVRDQMINHEQRMAVLAERITEAVRTVADLDAAAAELAVGHWRPHADIEAAEAERDQLREQRDELRPASPRGCARSSVPLRHRLTGLRPSPPRRVVGLRSDRCGDTLCPGVNRRWRWVALWPVSDRSR
jgi:hypothetical protein